jgi:glucose-6-phosphate 1-dehydrogenase
VITPARTTSAEPLASPSEERRPLPPVLVEEPVAIVIFGASGDLTQRKLMPALFELFAQGLFREGFAVVGFSRTHFTDESFRERVKQSVKTYGRLPATEAALDQFASHVYYQRGSAGDREAFAALKGRDFGAASANHVFYLALPPGEFLPTVASLKEAGLISAPDAVHWSRVVIEKPFGRDLASAGKLNLEVRNLLKEPQIYRIDHYLGKETVQNILGFRLANSIFEPIFNRHHVDHIQITAGETVGVESGRGGYYDSAGALRDMVQNHLLQLLCLVAMEPPSNLTADAVRGAKVQLLKSLAPPPPSRMLEAVVRGQYVSAEADGRRTPSYVEEERVVPDSRTETYCAIRLEIENWRWAGVPVYLRTGKRLRKRLTEIALQFRMPPLQLFRTVECVGDVCDLTMSHPNALVFRIQPDEGICLRFSAKRPAMQFVVESVAMDFSYSQTWSMSLPEAYERLLVDVMRGDSTLFTRSDEVEAAWQVVDPVLQFWQAHPDAPLHYYQPGSWGPSAADALLAADGRSWRNPD